MKDCMCDEYGKCFYHRLLDQTNKEQTAKICPKEEVGTCGTCEEDVLIMHNKSGTKYDDGKFDPTMLSTEMIELVSRVRMFGAKKYSRNNWKKGFKVTRSLAAALRHIYSFMNGENDDPESGLSHLGHAICCLEHAVYDMQHHKENDDRKD